MTRRQHYLPFLHMFGSAVIDQGVLSAANFVIGVILIRHVSNLQYGYYILALGAAMLLASLQCAFIGPQMVNRMIPLEAAARGELIGGLYRDQSRLILRFSGAALLVTATAWGAGIVDWQLTLLILATVATTPVMLNRSFYRMAMYACRRAQDVLLGDFTYTVVLLGGVVLATLSPSPAATVILVMGLASWIGGLHLLRTLRRAESFSTTGAPGILLKIAPLGFWSAGGAVIYWTFSQGYNFVVAGTLDVSSIAAIAATRLMLMPVNLLSTGISTLMLPLASSWLLHHGAATVMRRLALFALLMAGIAVTYSVVLWFLRDWVFIEVFRKHFDHRDTLLLFWSATFLVMAMRDQLIYLLVARERFRSLAALAFVSALCALAISYWGLLQFGVVGAPLGVLIGECINLSGILLLSWREARRRFPPAAAMLETHP